MRRPGADRSQPLPLETAPRNDRHFPPLLTTPPQSFPRPRTHDEIRLVLCGGGPEARDRGRGNGRTGLPGIPSPHRMPPATGSPSTWSAFSSTKCMPGAFLKPFCRCRWESAASPTGFSPPSARIPTFPLQSLQPGDSRSHDRTHGTGQSSGSQRHQPVAVGGRAQPGLPSHGFLRAAHRPASAGRFQIIPPSSDGWA